MLHRYTQQRSLLLLGLSLVLLAACSSSTPPSDTPTSPRFLGEITLSLHEGDYEPQSPRMLSCASFRFLERSIDTSQGFRFSAPYSIDVSACPELPATIALVPLNLPGTIGNSPLFGTNITEEVADSLQYPDALAIPEQADALNASLLVSGEVIPVVFAEGNVTLTASAAIQGGIVLGVFAGLDIPEEDPEDSLAIRGRVRDDASGAGLAGFSVIAFIDNANDGMPDAGQPVLRTQTDAEGNYRFSGLDSSQRYSVMQELPFGWASSQLEVEPGNVQGQIVGGFNANHATYPFIVSIQDDDDEHSCGGTLISERWVLSATHCFVRKDGSVSNASELSVLLGTADSSDEDGQGQRVNVLRIINHPDYDPESFNNDIALLELATAVPLGNGIHTIAMLEDASLEVSGSLATVIGWGALQESGIDPNILQSVNLPLQTTQEQICRDSLNPNADASVQICAGVPQGSIDTCQGDSGGPLLLRNPSNDAWLQVGIVSYGEGCARPGTLGVYARMSALRDWVEANALETSERFSVVPQADDVIVDFGNRRTTLPASDDGNIITLETTVISQPRVLRGSRQGIDETTLTIDVAIFGEASGTASCLLEGPGLSRQLPCSFGDNSFDVAVSDIDLLQLEDYLLDVEVDGIGITRPAFSSVIAAPLPVNLEASVSGRLEADVFALPRGTDIRYYLLEPEEAVDGTIFIISATVDTDEPALYIYDADTLSLVGTSDFDALEESDIAQVILGLQADSRYVIGLTHFSDDAADYRLNVTRFVLPEPRTSLAVPASLSGSLANDEVQYYDLDVSGLAEGTEVEISVSDSDFPAILNLYDADTSAPLTGASDEPLRFSVEAGRNYALSIASEDDVGGDFTLNATIP